MSKLIKILNSTSLLVIAIVILVAWLFFTKECQRDDPCPPEGQVLVSDAFLDSLNKVASAPPDTVIDTIILKGETVYVEKEVPVPVGVDQETNVYSDSLINDSISVWVDITVKGIIKEWDWKYKPVFTELKTTITKPMPQPIKYEVKVKDERTEVYAGIGLGGNQNAFMLSGEIDLITKKDHLYGLQYLRFRDENFYLFKIGTKISFRK